ncbi:MAG: PKD domain-containing protein [Candidatus Hydrogenedentes bacterium]|nr:PKD domain-containing protein [Candidatus Hydrogenedentota bacterium]
MHASLFCRVFAGAALIAIGWGAGAEIFARAALDTLTPVELNRGDELQFTLRNGETRTLALEATSARILLTNLPETGTAFHEGQTVYEMTCRVRIDGQSMEMRRYVPVQEALYEPYIGNGLRIWFDGVRDIQAFLNDNHGGGMPRTDARFAVQDMTLPVCPQPLRAWYPNADNYIDTAESYNANDVWMGPYQGADLHGGLDVNMPIGTPLWAPIDFDTQFYFNALAMGHNNNRWRGVRKWANGQRWVLQAHHIVRLHVPEHTPLKQGAHYAEAAGVLTGSHAHSHFAFKIGPEDEEALLDPWILFWQIFELNKERSGEIRAAMRPLSPAVTGNPVPFDGSASRAGVTGNGLRYRWTFGDGGTAIDAKPRYVYTAPGVYPVTLTVFDGVAWASQTQHVTVDASGAPIDRPALVLAARDSLAFRPRPVPAMDVYGHAPRHEPHTLHFLARPETSPRPAPRLIEVRNAGAGALAAPVIHISYREGMDWLSVQPHAEGLEIGVSAEDFPNRLGIYHADVSVGCPGALNSPQVFSVRLETPSQRDLPKEKVIVDNRDPGCEATPWYWVAPQFHRHYTEHWPPGYRGDYLVARANAPGEFVRFTPDLAAGRYTVSLASDTPFPPTSATPTGSRFAMRVRHKHGEETVWMAPETSRAIGEFEFSEGMDGYVEILAEGATGAVIADAVCFERVAE